MAFSPPSAPELLKQDLSLPVRSGLLIAVLFGFKPQVIFSCRTLNFSESRRKVKPLQGTQGGFRGVQAAFVALAQLLADFAQTMRMGLPRTARAATAVRALRGRGVEMRRNGKGTLSRNLATVALGLALALSLGAPLAAAPWVAAPARTEAAVAQTWLGTLWGWLQAVWGEQGSSIDPLGAAQVPPGEAPHGEQGGAIDPLG